MADPHREEWLKKGVRALRPLLRKADLEMPTKWAVTVGFASKARAIGQCWYPSNTPGGTTHIMIGPEHSDPVDALDTLLHEMVHAALGPGFGHGHEFKRACKKIGLTKGKATEAAAGPELRKLLERLAPTLGKFNHDPLARGEKAKGTKGGYWPVFASPIDPCYRIQISERALEEYGPPVCPICHEPMIRATGKAPAWPKPQKEDEGE